MDTVAFPVSHSILSASAIGAFVQEQYALKGEVTCTFLRSGINASYAIQSGNERFVFRAYTHGWRSRAEVNAEVALLRELENHGLSAAYPQADASGDYVQELAAPEGLRLAVLFTHAPGEKIHQMTPETHRAIGQWMGRLHQLTQDGAVDRVTYSAEAVLLDSLPKLGRFLPADTAEMAYLQQLQAYLLEQWKLADTRQLRRGAVHLDVWYDNLHVDADGTITVFDFDFLGNGWLCLDVAYFALQLHQIEREAEARQAKMEAFLAGYASVVPLAAEERRLLPMLGLSLYFFYLGVQCERFDNWSHTFVTQRYLQRFTNELVRRFAEENGIIVR